MLDFRYEPMDGEDKAVCRAGIVDYYLMHSALGNSPLTGDGLISGAFTCKELEVFKLLF